MSSRNNKYVCYQKQIQLVKNQKAQNELQFHANNEPQKTSTSPVNSGKQKQHVSSSALPASVVEEISNFEMSDKLDEIDANLLGNTKMNLWEVAKLCLIYSYGKT